MSAIVDGQGLRRTTCAHQVAVVGVSGKAATIESNKLQQKLAVSETSNDDVHAVNPRVQTRITLQYLNPVGLAGTKRPSLAVAHVGHTRGSIANSSVPKYFFGHSETLLTLAAGSQQRVACA